MKITDMDPATLRAVAMWLLALLGIRIDSLSRDELADWLRKRDTVARQQEMLREWWG